MTNARDRALELVEMGMISAEDMLKMAIGYMSADDVEDMLDANELSARFHEDADEDEYEDDGQPTWEQEWADFGEEY